MRLNVCVHEAGHAVVGWRVLGLAPSWVEVQLGPPLRAQCLFPGSSPRNAPAARQHAAMLAGGRAAILEAKGRGYLPESVDPDAGYSVPMGPRCDAWKLHNLEQVFGLMENEAKVRALDIVEREWPTIRRVAECLATGMPLYSTYLELLLTSTRCDPGEPLPGQHPLMGCVG